MALDVAIYSALAAAWYFKWRAPGSSRRPHPWEVDYQVNVTAGDDLGRYIARLLIEQLKTGCITEAPGPCDPADPCEMPPSVAFLDNCAEACCADEAEIAERQESGSEREEGSTPTRSRSRRAPGTRQRLPDTATLETAQGPQQGALPSGSNADLIAQAQGP